MSLPASVQRAPTSVRALFLCIVRPCERPKGRFDNRYTRRTPPQTNDIDMPSKLPTVERLHARLRRLEHLREPLANLHRLCSKLLELDRLQL